ncbi:hypothetical protein F5B21DRAFT_485346 [Xylaria acuta]|nr:hypothetical protein F5B21DRAFT_485346 [Xylaria acuta]
MGFFSIGNFFPDFYVAVGIAVGATIAILILVCVAAHFGPRMCGLGRNERWFAGDVEERLGPYGGGYVPLMTGEPDHH